MWAVRPVQTSSYVGFGVEPPEYPTDVETTPGTFQKSFSAPQKQPIPNSAISVPAGYGGRRAEPRTACLAGTGISVGRPGRISSAEGNLVLWGSVNQLMAAVYAAHSGRSAPGPGRPAAIRRAVRYCGQVVRSAESGGPQPRRPIRVGWTDARYVATMAR